MTDVPLLRKALEWAEAEAEKPEAKSRWQQRWWYVPAVGDPLRVDEAPDDIAYAASIAESRHRVDRTCGTAYCLAGYVDHLAGRDSPWHRVYSSAVELLGITGTEADILFDQYNDIGTLRRLAERIAGEKL